MKNKKKRLIIITVVIIGLYGMFIIAKRAVISDWVLKKGFHDKIWIHRVNSIEMLNELAPNYKGMEVDIVFDTLSKTFDVNHPPAKSIGLNLIDYLKANNDKSTNYWLDFKNLTLTNVEDAILRLEFVILESGYSKNNFIVESRSPSPLKRFHKNGFLTSYYLHWPGLFTLNNDEFNNKIKEIKSNINNEIDYLSSPYNDYEIIKENFPDKKMNIWVEKSKIIKREVLKEHLYRLKLANDTMVNVFLMKIETKSPNR